jgi:hypothetical protein
MLRKTERGHSGPNKCEAFNLRLRKADLNFIPNR